MREQDEWEETAGGGVTSAGRSREDLERERYRELLEELRTVMPGVQVLFGFLLVAPFSARFTELDRLGTVAFVLALVTAALATIVFVSPAPYHRLRGHRDRHLRVRDSVRAQLAGLVLLALATIQAVFVVARFVLDTLVGSLLAALVAAAVIGLWWVLPLLHRGGGSGR